MAWAEKTEKEELPRLGPFVWVSSRLWLTFAVLMLLLPCADAAIEPRTSSSSKNFNPKGRRHKPGWRYLRSWWNITLGRLTKHSGIKSCQNATKMIRQHCASLNGTEWYFITIFNSVTKVCVAASMYVYFSEYFLICYQHLRTPQSTVLWVFPTRGRWACSICWWRQLNGFSPGPKLISSVSCGMWDSSWS